MHESVLLKESVDALAVVPGKKYIDATFGAGGHTKAILERGGQVLAIEADPKMVARESANPFALNSKLIQGNFRDIQTIAQKNGFEEVDGILMDLGISSLHLDDDNRGFSFKDPNAPLDMRLNIETQGVRAADLLNSLDKAQLTVLLESKSLAQKVVNYRANKPFETVRDLLALFESRKRGKIHPATLAFMNLRIAVNSELENLREVLPKAYEILKKGGKLAVISFHSGEDRIVKEFFKDKNGEFLTPSREEIERNPRARSAKLRVITK